MDIDPDSELEQFLGAYFHEDYDLFGDTIEEIALCYKRVTSPDRIKQVCVEMDEFVAKYGAEAEVVFARHWGSFDPTLWGHSVASFFDELKRILNR